MATKCCASRRPDRRTPSSGDQFGEEQLIKWANRILRDQTAVRAVVRKLSHVLKQERGGVTTDDATIFLIEWLGGDASKLATFDRE